MDCAEQSIFNNYLNSGGATFSSSLIHGVVTGGSAACLIWQILYAGCSACRNHKGPNWKALICSVNL